MSNSQDNKYEKILDYLEVLTKSLNEFKSDVDRRFDAVDKRFDAIDKRFNAVDEDMGTLKGTTRRIEERQALAEKSIGIVQEADRARQDDIRQLDIRLSRVEDQLRSNPAPH